ncbi:hypothetical protein MIDIC_200021 [Alphaproteobacteria bacterium]
MQVYIYSCVLKSYNASRRGMRCGYSGEEIDDRTRVISG